MDWKSLLAQDRIAREAPSRNELDELRGIVDRNLDDAALAGISPEGRFEHAYNAARCMAVIAIRACGYRVKTAPGGGHWNTFQALLAVPNPSLVARQAYLDLCRQKRNDIGYLGGMITQVEADELLQKARGLRDEVEAWLARSHPELSK